MKPENRFEYDGCLEGAEKAQLIEPVYRAMQHTIVEIGSSCHSAG